MTYMKNYGYKFELLKKIINKDNPVIVEVGAHYGEDSLRFLETFPDLKLYCFEPDPRNIKIFKKYVTSNQCKLFEKALSDISGVAKFYQSYQPLDETLPEKYDWISREDYINNDLNNSGSSSLKKGYSHVKEELITVETIKGSSWLDDQNINYVDFMWIDVQGAEKEVIEGFEKQIDLFKFIWIEYGEVMYEGGLDRQQTIEMMKSKNFVCVDQLSSQEKQGDLLFINSRYVA